MSKWDFLFEINSLDIEISDNTPTMKIAEKWNKELTIWKNEVILEVSRARSEKKLKG
jgi:hypothetical protein